MSIIEKTFRAAALLLVFLIAGGGVIIWQTWSTRQLAGLLNIAELPRSLHDLTCEDRSWSDVLVTCVFSVGSDDFPLLLTGWAFSERQVSGYSHSYSGGPRLGKSFPVSVEFWITPAEFKYGGRIWLVTNADKTQVQFDYYEE